MDGRVRIKIEGMEREYEAMHCEYAFQKGITRNGEVCTDVSGGNILVALPTTPTDELMRWVFDPLSLRFGEIILDDMNKESMETLRFEGGRCIGFRLHYEPTDLPPNVIVLLTIQVARIITDTINQKTNSYGIL
ncbi:hypothetical protein AGMMS49525_15580 [Bacteroidia bacterium]|nr:hypothetical protein AGMMS49525_15580 [Bacteroidia bacterium]